MIGIKRVGLLNENLSGHATFHGHFARALRDQGRFDVRVVDAPPKTLLRRGLTSPLPMPEGWDLDFALFRNQVGQSVATRGSLKKLVEWADIVHMYTQNVSPLNIDLVKRRPLVVTSDATCMQTCGRFPFRYPGRGTAAGIKASTVIERRLMAQASLVVAQSEWARQSFIRDVGIAADRVRAISLGAPRPAQEVARPCDGIKRILYIGASMNRKGGYALLEAMQSHLSPTVELHLVTQAPVSPTPHVVVHSDIRPGDGQIAGLLASCDVFALPSDMDMTPNAIWEAMSYGLPVVAYRSGGIPEMVLHGESGLLADEGDMDVIRSSILGLLADPDRASAYGSRGRALLADKFDPDRAIAEFVDALDTV